MSFHQFFEFPLIEKIIRGSRKIHCVFFHGLYLSYTAFKLLSSSRMPSAFRKEKQGVRRGRQGGQGNPCVNADVLRAANTDRIYQPLPFPFTSLATASFSLSSSSSRIPGAREIVAPRFLCRDMRERSPGMHKVSQLDTVFSLNFSTDFPVYCNFPFASHWSRSEEGRGKVAKKERHRGEFSGPRNRS